MSDEIRERLANLDPMHSRVPTEPTTTESSRELMERVMSTPVRERTEPPVDRGHRTWAIGAAAVAALVLAVAGGVALTGGNGMPDADNPPLELTAGGEDLMASCMMFSPEELERVAELAFEGTVTMVEGDRVTLSVDTWYRGGEVARVALTAPQGMEALIGGIPFETGEKYLISAQAGSVNYCGFSGPSTPELKAGFEQAFAAG